MPADQSPGQRDFPPPKDAGTFDIRIARDGTWYHEGGVIGRKPLVKLLASVLWRDDGGVYWLQTPVEKGRITVEDAPFTAVELSVRGEGKDQILAFRTNLDDWVEADSEHPLRVAENPENGEISPYILVRGRLEALILRPVYYELAELAVAATVQGPESAESLGVWSKGVFFPLGRAA
ncbi:DUF1285 domain-containing protein [Pelagibius sp. 7325]|uniref:DUF1285 domain-containing protein n=1 Tax=Pelagibius sp. 7325 TaxID=3131994 RepID=UPI0030EE675E